jgi:hypothetical protein
VVGDTRRYGGAHGWMDCANVDGQQRLTVTVMR